MNFKFHSIHIDPAAPFQEDQLNREPEIRNLSTLISNLNSPAVLAIDSPWGTGKTTFIKMWEAFLKSPSQGIESLYFNAWETDFSDDPLVSFLGEMNEGFSRLIDSSEKSAKIWERTKSIGSKLARRGIPALVKIATSGVIDAEKIIEDEASKLMESLTGDALDSYLKQKSAIAEFHESLTKLIADPAVPKPVVVFVDELDRCRPTYAISLLERIKHLFNIEGLVFVLALDKIQLGYSIGAVYGDKIDSVSYLRRFFDFEYQLKKPEISAYIKSLCSALELDNFFEPRKKYRGSEYDKEHLEQVFLMLAECQKLSLREIEQLLASINLALRTAKENQPVYTALLAFLIVAKNKRPELYRQYILPSSSESKMVEYLRELMPEPIRYESFECALVEGFLIAAKMNSWNKNEPEMYAFHQKTLEEDAITDEQREYSRRVVNIANNPNGSPFGIDLKVLVERIEMISQFQFE